MSVSYTHLDVYKRQRYARPVQNAVPAQFIDWLECQELTAKEIVEIINMTDDSRETVETASAFIAEQSYSFPVFYDTDQDAASTYGVYSIPTTYFIDADGNVIAQATGVIGAETLQQGIDMIFEDD